MPARTKDVLEKELLRSQRELASMRAHYFDLYDLAPVGLLTLSEKGATLEANFTTARLLGVKKEALLKRRLDDFVDPEDRERFARHQRLFVAGDAPANLELHMLRGSADRFWARLDLTLGHGTDGVLMFRVMLSDITERRRAEETLARILGEREAILKAIPDAYYRLNSEMKLTDWNQAFERATGYGPQKLRGMSALRFFKTDQKAIAEGIQEAVEKGHAYRAGRLLTREGREIPYFWSGAAVRSADGHLAGLVGIGRDLTAN
ncbi:MAG: PAS domain-containing protein [Elusimicrobiota bacterium]